MTSDNALTDSVSNPPVPPALLHQWSLEPLRYLGGRANRHWLVRQAGRTLVLRGYAHEYDRNFRYELEVLRQLHQQNWPVPQVVDDPVESAGRWWCLFTMLPGTSGVANGPDDRRARGRLLATLHEATAAMTDLGQRDGFQLADEVVREPGLFDALRQYEQRSPDTGHLLLWHLEQLIAMFDRTGTDGAKKTILHGDLAPWNLLFENGQVSGILDFESTHLNYRVSDFALAWRGYQHEVIKGYEEIHPLPERDRHLIVPAFWSWIYINMKGHIEHALAANEAMPPFEWPVKQLLRRSAYHDVESYLGRANSV